MDLHDQVPVRVLYVLEADVAENAGIVDEHVDASEGGNGGLDDLLAVLEFATALPPAALISLTTTSAA